MPDADAPLRTMQEIQAHVGKLADTIKGVRSDCQQLVEELVRDHSPPEPDWSDMADNKRAPNVAYYLQGFLAVIDDDELVETEERFRDAANCTDESLRDSWYQPSMSESTMTASPGAESRKVELRAVWMRISEHAEGLRRIIGDLGDVSEAASPDLLDRLADHATGVRQVLSDLELIAATTAQRDSTCSDEATSL